MGGKDRGKILTLFSELSYLHHEFPDLIFSKSYGKFNAANVSSSMRSTRYDSLKEIKTVYLGTLFLYAVNIS